MTKKSEFTKKLPSFHRIDISIFNALPTGNNASYGAGGRAGGGSMEKTYYNCTRLYKKILISVAALRYVGVTS